MTATANPLWFRVDLSKTELKDEAVLSCCLSKVFCYRASRNAYWSTEYISDHAYSYVAEILKQRAEGERIRGTTFRIYEVPALAIMGETYDILLVDYSSDTPFKGVTPPTNTIKTVLALARFFQTTLSESNAFAVSSGHAVLPSLPYKTYRSVPRGSAVRLGWKGSPNRINMGVLTALIGHTNASLHTQS